MFYKTNQRKILILLIVSVLSILVLSDFDLTKRLSVEWGQNTYFITVSAFIPLFFIFLYFNTQYLKFSYAEGKNVLQKLCFGVLNFLITIGVFVLGFEFWKRTQGDVDVAFFSETKDAFELTFRNIYFWTFYQTLLLVYGVSVLKIMVSRLPKK
jgi:hypothetical protein